MAAGEVGRGQPIPSERPHWRPDVLPGYDAADLAIDAGPAPGEPSNVRPVATLVRRHAGRRRRRAVLYVHGWNDYFFQTHLADFWAEQGYAFYAVDLRRYGRSLRPGQLQGFVTDLADYAAELDAAHAELTASHDSVLLMGHSTGGLVAALWAADHPGAVSGLVLNSPWLDLQGSPFVKLLGTPVIQRLGTSRPTTALRLPDIGFYARTLHLSREGEWDYDLAWKTSPSPPIRAGWLRAILRGHQQIAAGVDVGVPVLVLCSTRSDFRRQWSEELRGVDVVLDADQIAARAHRLGRHVTVVRIDGGLHDLVLSRAEVRTEVFSELRRWVRGVV